MFRLDNEGLARDRNGKLQAIGVDHFVTGVVAIMETDLVIFRLYRSGHEAMRQLWKQGDLVPIEGLQQFALNADSAQRLGQALLELAAQIEKENDESRAH